MFSHPINTNQLDSNSTHALFSTRSARSVVVESSFPTLIGKLTPPFPHCSPIQPAACTWSQTPTTHTRSPPTNHSSDCLLFPSLRRRQRLTTPKPFINRFCMSSCKQHCTRFYFIIVLEWSPQVVRQRSIVDRLVGSAGSCSQQPLKLYLLIDPSMGKKAF